MAPLTDGYRYCEEASTYGIQTGSSYAPRLGGSGGAVCQPANQPEHEALETLWPSCAAHGQVCPSPLTGRISVALYCALKAQGLEIIATPWPLRNRGRFPKEQFQIKIAAHEGTCPAGQTVRRRDSGHRVQFPAETCGKCALQAQ